MGSVIPLTTMAVPFYYKAVVWKNYPHQKERIIKPMDGRTGDALLSALLLL